MPPHTLTLCVNFILLVLLQFSTASAAYEQAIIEKASGDRISFKVELARTEAELQQGLMYRRELKPGHGMLFIFPHEKLATFWMKNTYIPLDIIFFNKEGKVIGIHQDLKPGSLEYVSSGGYTLAALEVPAGTVKKYGFTTTDKLIKPSLP